VRRAAVWQACKFDRYPDVIVRVTSDQDVVEAVRRAREEGLKVKARGGGHSHTGSALREGMMIDFSDYKEFSIDPEARTATVTPSVWSSTFGAAASEHGLFFPGGHCPDVGMGGYLLQGGFGWNGRTLGMACSSVRAIDVVTADGELIHCDDTSNGDYMWAARGAGPGFFGVVTRFYLDLHPAPESMLCSVYVYPIDVLTELLPWFLETAQAAPRAVEPFLMGAWQPGAEKPVLIIFLASYYDSEQEGRHALAPFDASPAIDRAVVRNFATPTTYAGLYELVEEPPMSRYHCDGMWTREPPATLVPHLYELFETLPPPKSTLFVMPWCEADVPNAAFSMQAPLYVSPYATWDDERDDKRNSDWVINQMRRLEPFSVGIQLADENLINRPAPFMAPENLRRLEQLRAKHDPDGLFHSYLAIDA
jgi:FAD/FMN-containing dehydrogenase